MDSPKTRFETLEELSAWYETAADGFAKCISTELHIIITSRRQEGGMFLPPAIMGLNKVYTSLYQQMSGGQEPTNVLSFNDLAKRYSLQE